MTFKDYYKVLGLLQNATEEEIRKRFKQLAKEFHPDKRPDDPKAGEKFKEINEAKEVLLDVNARSRYDQLLTRHQAFAQQQARARTTTPPREDSRNPVVDDMFSAFFDGMFGGSDPVKGRNSEANVKISLQEAFTGVHDVLGYEGKKLRVHIPPGVRQGQSLRIRGQGEPGRNGGEPGDLVITILISPDKRYTREGDHLLTEIQVDLYTAVLGGKAGLNTFKGRIQIDIPSGSQPGDRLRLLGMGMPRYGEEGRGDLLVTLRIQLPKYLSDEQRKLFEQLAKGK
ncbi:MAG: J domain-containing protein [Bacteroidetes bacterium]|nr:MAG: J domain-containing protein [Bacteroidota bacterium]